MHTEATTFNCDVDYDCEDETKTCTNNEDCIIHCTRYRSCYRARFICPTSTNPNNELLCQVTCGDGTTLSSQTCVSASFNASGSSILTLTIDSVGTSISNSPDITVGCPKSGICNIECGNAQRGCSYMSVYGEQSAVMISSGGRWGFESIKVFASQASSLTMIATGSDAFYYNCEIYCPNSNKQQPPLCNITYSNTASYTFYQTTFYCVDSFWDLNLFCPEFSTRSCIFITSSWSSKPIMRCISDYTQSCTMTTIDGKYWTCESSSSACAVRVPTPPPTAAPTGSPTASPTASSVVIISITMSTLIIGLIIAFIIWWMKCRNRKALSKSIIKKKDSVQKYQSLVETQQQNNLLMSKYQIGSSVKNWNNSDVVNWIKGIGLSSKWAKDTITKAENKNIKGQDMMHLGSGKDIGKLFELDNPMLCSRLWRELQKIKQQRK